MKQTEEELRLLNLIGLELVKKLEHNSPDFKRLIKKTVLGDTRNEKDNSIGRFYFSMLSDEKIDEFQFNYYVTLTLKGPKSDNYLYLSLLVEDLSKKDIIKKEFTLLSNLKDNDVDQIVNTCSRVIMGFVKMR